ncbi:MAG: ABC transporter ATP-binding protein/permease [Lachnospiraceae bacterium]|nr:ABC transporter ATP-binding protein/permease [Lachnospiraceae bacterium]
MRMIVFSRKLLKPYWKLILLVVILELGQAFLTLYLPTLNAGIIDYGTVHADMEYVSRIGVVMLILSFVQFVFNVMCSFLGSKIAMMAGRDLRAKTYKKILSLSQREVASFGAPTLITRATNDAQQIVQFYMIFFTRIINAPIMFIGGMFLALSQDLMLSSVIFITIPILVVIAFLFVKNIVPFYRTKQTKIDLLNGVLRDQITGMRVVRAFNKEDFEKNKMEDANEQLFHLNLAIGYATALLVPIFTLIVSFSKIALLWLGGSMATGGQVQIGMINAFVTYTSFILSATLIASMVFIQLPKADVSAERLDEIFNTECSVKDDESAKDIDIPDNAPVRFDHVSFSYAPENKDVRMVLEDISFTAYPGQMTAIIGSTGSGKSTLINLISRFADVTGGSILLGDTDIRNIKLPKLLSMIGLVPQKSYMFSGTLEKNLRYAKKDATDKELWEALKVAQADDFIREKDGQLNMIVSEGGSNYSGGQRQRLCIARAVVRKPRIFLFDDSFSALDSATDKKLREALKPITKDSIYIVVAQRIGSIKDADQIIVMNEGRIADIGRHDELVERCSVYREIVASQPQ